jgi:hypothetical protein
VWQVTVGALPHVHARTHAGEAWEKGVNPAYEAETAGMRSERREKSQTLCERSSKGAHIHCKLGA